MIRKLTIISVFLLLLLPALLQAETRVVRLPVILVEHETDPKFKFRRTKAEFEQLFNGVDFKGWAGNPITGSVRDYYRAVSGGKLDIQFEVFGPVPALGLRLIEGEWKNDNNFLAREAIDAAKEKYGSALDFSRYETFLSGGERVLSGFYLITAGQDWEWFNPQASSISHLVDGVRMTRFGISGELRGGGNIVDIGIIVHEFGHAFFNWPDTYGPGSTIGGHMYEWCLMGSGNYNDFQGTHGRWRTPAFPSAYLRVKEGWAELIDLTIPADITIPNPADRDVVYRLATSVPGEYFYIENRQKNAFGANGWESALPASGMLIYHRNRNAPHGSGMMNRDSTNMAYSIRAAGNVGQRAEWAFPRTGRTEFTSTSTPNSLTHGGLSANGPITNIVQNSDGSISFKYRGGTPALTDVALTEILLPSTIYGESTKEIRVVIKNQGIPISSAKITWGFNGREQPDFLWTGNLSVDEYDTLTIGEIDFVEGLHNIAVAIEINGNINTENRRISREISVEKRSPFFSEDFEGDISGWIFANDHPTDANPNRNAVNKWFVGEAAASSGKKSIYISDDGGLSNKYDTEAGWSLTHFYRDITFPQSPDGFDFYFDVKVSGEWGAGASTDYLHVRVVETDVTIAAGAFVPAGGDTLGNYTNIPTWRRVHHNLPASYSGTTKRLVFSWINNNTRGVQPPAAIDNIAILARSDTGTTSIVNVERSNNRYGIRFAVNPVSDRAEISVVLPNNERAVEANVIIYDMVGNVVWASTGSATGLSWDLRNTAGRFVANGTYLVIAEAKDRNGRIYRYSARLGVKR